MRPDIAASRRRAFRGLVAELRPAWGRDAGLAGRLERLLRANRRFGARDRRLYRELVYTTLRYLPWVEPRFDPAPDLADAAIAWLAADTEATRDYRTALLDGWPPCPPTLGGKAQVLAPVLGAGADGLPSLLPRWAREECPAAAEPAEYEALHRRAPLWLRLKDDPAVAARVLDELAARGWRSRPSALLPGALRIDDEADVTATDAFRTGGLEIQDIGSQWVLASAAPAPGGRWLDACAGAGGKSLQLADLLGAAGRVEVHDIRAAALDELELRTRRAGLAGRIRRTAAPDAAAYDGVLVDAPCSGSGTWRRQPQLKWSTTPERIGASAALQAELLARFCAHVRPGGRLVYATCSLCRRENEAVVAGFLASHPHFLAERPPGPAAGRPAGPGWLLRPSDLDGDGFFAAFLRRSG